MSAEQLVLVPTLAFSSSPASPCSCRRSDPRYTLPLLIAAPTGIVYRDDERYWLSGVIYNNPDDPDLIVPKRFGNGLTVNVGRPLGKVLLIGPLLPVVLGILGILFPGSITSFGCHPSGCHLWP